MRAFILQSKRDLDFEHVYGSYDFFHAVAVSQYPYPGVWHNQKIKVRNLVLINCWILFVKYRLFNLAFRHGPFDTNPAIVKCMKYEL